MGYSLQRHRSPHQRKLVFQLERRRLQRNGTESEGVIDDETLEFVTIMKFNGLRPVASLYRPLFPGVAASIEKFTSSAGICPSSGRFQCEGVKSWGREVHSLSCEDDFSELGPPVMENGAKPLKLVTEKPEPRLKDNSVPQVKLSGHFPSEDWRCRMNVVRGSPKISQTSRIKQDQSNTPSLVVLQNHGFKVDSAMTTDQDKSQKLDISCSVSIQSVPSTIGLSDLVQAMSVFGKVSCARIRSVSDGLYSCDVEFVNSESSRRAVLAGEATLESIHLPIRPLCSSDLVTIRVEGIVMETTDRTVHSMCKSSGALEGLEVAGKDAVNAIYRVKNDAQLQKILERLNNTIVDGHCWSAYQLPCKSASLVISTKEDDRTKLGLQLNNRLGELRKHLGMKKIYFEDLQLLHLGIFHLQGLPTNDEPYTSRTES